jgi:uncharacterized protein (DUF58 family)
MIRESWVLLTALLVVGGLAAGNGAVVALGLGVGIACYAAQLWARFSLRRVTYERLVPEDHAFAGERVRIDLRITNNKPLPLPWIETRERFPEAMISGDDDDFATAGQISVVQTDWRTSIGAHQSVRREYELQ